MDDINRNVSRTKSQRYVRGTDVAKPPNVDGKGLLPIITHPLCILLLCLPLGIAGKFQGWSDLWIFWCMFLAMIPLAKIMGDATEELAAGLHNDMLAGLLNATFGNAVEMVITVQTMRAELFNVVKASLLGSVLSNMLLVLGMSFFFGGIVGANKPVAAKPSEDPVNPGYTPFVAEKVQKFEILSAMVNTSMLLLSCLSFSLLTVFCSVNQGSNLFMDEKLLPVSRVCSCIIISAYVAFIIFQLGTHRKALAEAEGEDGDEDEDGAVLSVAMSATVLLVTTAIVAFASEILVEAIEGVVEQAHIGQHFIGIILLPIVGNACEHASAIRFAMQDKPGLSIGIAVGSSTQIALFVVPFSVLLGWAMDKHMDLDFGALNTTVMTLAVVVVLSMVVDGQSNWLQGYLLCAAYAIIAVLYWYLPDDESKQG